MYFHAKSISFLIFLHFCLWCLRFFSSKSKTDPEFKGLTKYQETFFFHSRDLTISILIHYCSQKKQVNVFIAHFTFKILSFFQVWTIRVIRHRMIIIMKIKIMLKSLNLLLYHSLPQKPNTSKQPRIELSDCPAGQTISVSNSLLP